MLFGFAINNDPKALPAALVTASHDQYSRAMISALELTGYYRFDHVTDSAAEAEALIQRGDVAFVVTIPSDFGARVVRGDRPRILVEADATDPAAASGAICDARHRRRAGAAARDRRARRRRPRRRDGQLEVVVHRRYNPEGISQYNIVPGLLGVILQMTMVMMTSMALTRETERGTMENLLAMPSTATEVMLSKILPYLAVGAVQVTVVLLAARGLFAVPFVGRLSVLIAAVFVFVLALVLLGYAISSFARTQMQAMQLTFFFFLPSILLSGFMFPFRGMPGWAQVARRDLPADPLHPRHPGGDAEGRRPRDDLARDGGARRSSSPPTPPSRSPGSAGRWTDRAGALHSVTLHPALILLDKSVNGRVIHRRASDPDAVGAVDCSPALGPQPPGGGTARRGGRWRGRRSAGSRRSARPSRASRRRRRRPGGRGASGRVSAARVTPPAVEIASSIGRGPASGSGSALSARAVAAGRRARPARTRAAARS